MAQVEKILGSVIVNRGNYDSSNTYYKDNVVLYLNSSYICKVAATNQEPGEEATDWDLFSGVPIVVLEPGDSEVKVMSQKAVTDTYGSIEESPEWIYAQTDSEGKFLFGIHTDGSIEWAKGVPAPIQKELTRLENNLDELVGGNLSEKIDNINEIFDFLEGVNDNETLLGKLTELNDKIDANNENVSLLKERVSVVEEKTEELNHEDNPEFIDVTLDADGKILEGIKEDGTKYLPNKFQHGEIIKEFIENPEYLEVTTDNNGKVIEGITKDGQKYLAKPSNQDENLQDQIDEHSQKIDEINEKIGAEAYDIPGEVDPENPEAPVEPVHVDATGIYKRVSDLEEKTSDLNHEENPEYIEVTTDAEGKVLEGIKEDGTKFFGNKIQQGDVIITEISDNPEYLEVTTDSEGKVIEGITTNGQKYLGKPSNQDEKLQEQIDNLLGSDELQNKVDDAIAQIDEKLEDLPFDSIDNPEYIDVTLDEEDKIIESITTDGEKQVNIPHTFNRKVTFNDEIKMNEKGQSSIINIIKNSGIKFDCCVDWSEATAIEIPRPTKCALVKITGTIPTSKFNDNSGYLEFWDMSGNYFKKKIIWNLQGRSSQGYIKKNFGFDLLNEDDSEFTVKFGDWPTQDSFHLKGNGNDFLAISSYVPYRWQTLISESRPEYNQYPYERIRNYSNQTIAEALLGGNGDIEDDFKPAAKCHPDGFPVMLFLNNIPWGLYFMNLKKSKEVYNVAKNSDDASQMCYNSDISTYGFMNRFNGRYWNVLVQQLTDTTGINKWDENTVYQVGDIVWDEETFDFEINGNTSAVTIRRKFECILSTDTYPHVHNTTKPQSAWISSIEIRNPKEMVAKQTDGRFTQYDYDSPSDYSLVGFTDYTHEPITADDLAAAIAYNKATKNDKYPFNEDNQKIGKMKPKNWEKACKRSVKVREKLELRSKLIPVMRFMTDTNISEWGFSSKTEAVKAIFEEYYDLSFLIDYFIIDNLIGFADNVINNNIYLLYDGKHLNSTLYDTDCCLFTGTMSGGIQAYPTSNVSTSLYTNTYTYMGILYDYYLSEIKTRWAELRNNGVITYETFCKLVDEHISAIGIDNLIEEKRLWGIITMHRPAAYWLMSCGNCLIGEDEDGLPIHYFDESNNTEISDCETWEEGKSYVSGTKVNYNGHNYSCVWNHTSSADKRPDKAKSYGSPNLGGFYDTTRKRKEWVRQRIINLDTKFGYTSNN